MDIRRGIIRAFDSGTYLADVQIVGSMATILTGVPVAKQIGAELLTSGTKCGVLFFDETNPADGCVAFVYDGVPSHPSARVYHSVSQSIPNAIVTALAFDSERFDTDNIHDPTINNSRLTCKMGGKYLIIANIVWARVAGGRRVTRIRLNGATDIASVEIGSVADNTAYPSPIVSTIYDLSVNDYVELTVLQTSGVAVAVLIFANFSPEFMMVKVA